MEARGRSFSKSGNVEDAPAFVSKLVVIDCVQIAAQSNGIDARKPPARGVELSVNQLPYKWGAGACVTDATRGSSIGRECLNKQVPNRNLGYHSRIT